MTRLSQSKPSQGGGEDHFRAKSMQKLIMNQNRYVMNHQYDISGVFGLPKILRQKPNKPLQKRRNKQMVHNWVVKIPNQSSYHDETDYYLSKDNRLEKFDQSLTSLRNELPFIINGEEPVGKKLVSDIPLYNHKKIKAIDIGMRILILR